MINHLLALVQVADQLVVIQDGYPQQKCGYVKMDVLPAKNLLRQQFNTFHNRILKIKKMKKIYFLLALLIFLLSCQQRKNGSIGELSSEGKMSIRPEIVDSLFQDWNKLLKQDSINTTIRELKILKEKEVGQNTYYYVILGFTNSDSAKVVTHIELKNDEFFFPKSEVINTTICYGSLNCYPRMSKGSWYCDDGSLEVSCSKNCNKKTVSSVK